MAELSLIAAVIVALSMLMIIYAYLAYPLFIWSLAKAFGSTPTRPVLDDDEWPFVSLLIVAHNEEADIEERVKNALALDYPVGRIEILVASDGSADRTADIVEGFAAQGVRLLDYPLRRGKAAVLNDAMPETLGEIIVLSDANTSFNAGCVRNLAAWFKDPSTGAVCGRLVLTDPRTGKNVDSLYWKYETFLKKCESRLGALLGSNGAIYAIRKTLFEPIPAETIVDDFVIPLRARQLSGCRIIYDRSAVACEETPVTIGSEFRRRTRIGAGGFQSIGLLRGLLHPRHGWICFTFWSHKVLRWVCPFWMLAAVFFSGCLVGDPTFASLFVGQAAFYALSIAAICLPAQPRFLRFFRLGTMFTMMNAALFVGFVRWLLFEQNGAWERTERSLGTVPAREAISGNTVWSRK